MKYLIQKLHKQGWEYMKSIGIIVAVVFLGIIGFMIYDSIFNQDPLSLILLILFIVIIVLSWMISLVTKSNPNSKVAKILQKIKDFIEGGLP